MIGSSRVQLLDFDDLSEGALPQCGEDLICNENHHHRDLRVVQWAARRTKAGIGIPSLTFTFPAQRRRSTLFGNVTSAVLVYKTLRF